MTPQEFAKLPLLLREGQVVEALGVSRQVVRAMAVRKELRIVSTPGGQRKYLQVDVARVAGIKSTVNAGGS